MRRERTCNVLTPLASRIHFYWGEGEAEGMGEKVPTGLFVKCRKAPPRPGGALQAWLAFHPGYSASMASKLPYTPACKR